MDNETAKLLGMPAAAKSVPAVRPKKIDVSQALRLRFQKGCTFEEIAKLMGCASSSVYEALAPYKKILEQGGTAIADDAMGELLSAAATVHLADCVDPEKRAKMSGKDHAIALGILTEKSRLFKGQSTSNQSVFFQVVGESSDSDTPQDVVVDGEFEELT